MVREAAESAQQLKTLLAGVVREEVGMSSNRQPPIDPGEETSLAPLTQIAVEPRKTPAALSSLMVKEFSLQKDGGEFLCEGDR